MKIWVFVIFFIANSSLAQVMPLPKLICHAVKNAPQFSKIQKHQLQGEAALWGSKIPLETKVGANAALSQNQGDIGSEGGFGSSGLGQGLIFTEDSEVSSLGVNTSTGLKTGTDLNVGLQYQELNLTFIGGSEQKFYNTQYGLELTQDLWRNAFGRGDRKKINAGVISKEASEHEFTANEQTEIFNLLDSYINSWFSHRNLQIARLRQKKHKEYLEIVKFRHEKGSAAKPDLLRAERKWTESKRYVEETSIDYINKLQKLASTMYLPPAWTEENKGLDLDLPALEKWQSLCTSENLPKESPALKSLAKNLEASHLNYDVRKDELNPKFNLSLGVTGNSFERSSSQSLEESFNESPDFQASVNLVIPLDNYKGKADLFEEGAKRLHLQSNLSELRKDLISQKTILCHRLDRLQKILGFLEETKNTESLLIKELKDRWNVGRMPFVEVIRAIESYYATITEVAKTRSEIYRSYWQLQQLYGKLWQEKINQCYN